MAQPGGAQGGTAGTFSDSGQTLGNQTSFAVSLGDLDGDGDLDAFVANYGEANRVWINQGGAQGGSPGTFSDSGQTLGAASSVDISLGDLDGDGDLDAFVANSGGANRVWLNDGTGTFSDSGQTLGAASSVDISLGDLDGDGDLDAFVANYGQPNRVWLNVSTVLFGDFNENNVVDAADYVVWRHTLAASGTFLPNDPTPGTVDESDYLYWRAHFGETLGAGSGAAATVPEPNVTDEALADAAATEGVEPAAAAPAIVVETEPGFMVAPAPAQANSGGPLVISKSSDTSGAVAGRGLTAVRALDFLASTNDFLRPSRAQRPGPAHSRISQFFATVDDDELLLLATAKVRKERPADRDRFVRAEADEKTASEDAAPRDAANLDDPLACVLADWC